MTDPTAETVNDPLATEEGFPGSADDELDPADEGEDDFPDDPTEPDVVVGSIPDDAEAQGLGGDVPGEPAEGDQP
jgi:hypothetical protein